MSPLLGRQRRKPVIASASRITSARSSPETKRRKEQWSVRVWDYYNTIGEVNYASQFWSRMLSKIVVYPALLPPQGDPDADPIPIVPGMVDPATVEYDADGQVVEGSGVPIENVDTILQVWSEVQDPGGGRRTIQGRYGQIMFVAGDGYLAKLYDLTPGYTEPNGVWQFLSNEEVDTSGNSEKEVKIKRSQTSTAATYTILDPDQPVTDKTAELYRVWRSHPRFSHDADSPLRSNMEVCESLLLLAADERATARSRLIRGGVLFIPDEMSDPVVPDDEVEPQDDPKIDPWLREVTDHFRTAIENEGSVSSFVPIVIRGPADLGSKILRIDFTSGPNAYPASEKRTEAVTRLSIGLDMPPEELLGKSDANHWTGWLIGQDAWQAHGQPVTEQMCADFSMAYYRPALLAASVAPELVERICLWYDAEAVIGNPDRRTAANDAHDRGTISDKAHREANGFDDDDAPSDANPNNNPKVLMALARESAGGLAAGTDEGSTGDEPATTEPTPPNDGEAPARIMGAAEAAVIRCREVAGSRLAARARDLPRLDKDQIASYLGPKGVADLANGKKEDLSPEALVSGGTSTLATLLARWEIPTGMAMHILSQVERHAADTLYEPHPEALPPDLYWS